MLNFKKGDQVKIMSGKDRGTTGKILSMNLKSGRAVVEGRNLLVRHEKPKAQGQKGQKIQTPAPVNFSKLMLVCPHCGKATRLGRKTDEHDNKLRVCKQCGKEIA